MSGGKTKQQAGVTINLRELRPRARDPLQRCAPQEVVELLTEPGKRKSFSAGFKDIANQAQLERYLDPGLQRHFATLFSATFPEIGSDDSRRALHSWLAAIPNPRPRREQALPALRRAYLQQLQKTLRQAPSRPIIAQEQEKITATLCLLQDIEQGLPETTELVSEYKQPIEDLLRRLQQAPGRGGTQVPRPESLYAARDRLYEALEHALYAAQNTLDLRPDSSSAVTVIGQLSDCAVKISGADPEYKSLHVDNFVQSQPDPEALRPYWDIFAAACQQK
jgi:hypothetical protein